MAKSGTKLLFGRPRFYALEKADRIDDVSHAAKLVALHIADQCPNDQYEYYTHDPFQLASFAMVKFQDIEGIMNELINSSNDLIMTWKWNDDYRNTTMIDVMVDSFIRA